uniref:Mpv17-like protein 2 n=1 Tax=Panagrolaimus superbus TaxID=310955 RepID=A0A914YUU6_9BILA
MNCFLRFVKAAYSPRFLVFTNTANICFIYGAADVFSQYVENNGNFDNFDWRRALRVSSVGLVHGPMCHHYYKWLDGAIIKGTEGQIVLKKVFIDLICSPFFAVTFIAGVTLLEGNSVLNAVDEYRRKFWTIFALDCVVWPPAQTVNFWLIPPPFRVFFVSSMIFVYTCCLSYIKHQKEERMKHAAVKDTVK